LANNCVKRLEDQQPGSNCVVGAWQMGLRMQLYCGARLFNERVKHPVEFLPSFVVTLSQQRFVNQRCHTADKSSGTAKVVCPHRCLGSQSVPPDHPFEIHPISKSSRNSGVWVVYGCISALELQLMSGNLLITIRYTILELGKAAGQKTPKLQL